MADHHHQRRVIKTSPPLKCAPKYNTQEDGVSEEASNTAARTNEVPSVLTQVGIVSDEAFATATTPNAEVGVQAVPPVVAATVAPAANPKANTNQRSVEKNFGLALNGRTYANTEFVKAFTQLMKKVYIVSKIIQSEPMPDFRKKSSTPSLTKKEKKGFVGDTKPCLYGHNVVNYVTIKKYMILYWEILVWYMENVKYPSVPEYMDQGLWFYTKQGGHMASTGQVFLPIRLPSVFHFVLHYKDLVTNLYHIHFEFNKNIVTILPSKLGEGKIRLAPAAVLKLPHIRYFGFQDVMQTIEDLVLKEQRYLAQSQFPDKEYEEFQHDDCLYIYPPKGSEPKNLIKSLLKMPDVGHTHQSVTQFLCYDVRSQQKLHQWIFMDDIPYVFCKIFVTDPEVLCNNLLDEWLPILIHYSSLPENRKIFTPLTEPLCFRDSKADLENFKKSHTSSYASGWVMFTSKCVESLYHGFIPPWLFQYRQKDTVPPPHDDSSDKMEDNVNQSDQGNNKDGDLDNKGDNVSDPGQDKGNKSDQGNDKDGTPDNDGDNMAIQINDSNDVSDPRQDKGNKSDEGNDKDGTLDNDSNLKPKVEPTTLKGTKSSLVRDLEFAPKDGTHSMHTQSQNGNNNELEQNVQLLNYSLDVTVPKSPLRVGQGFVLHDIKVMLKNPDPEILSYLQNCLCYSEKHGKKSGKAQRNNKGNLLGDEDSNSCSDSNHTLDNDKGSVYDPAVEGNSESKDNDEC
eukprot:jgi/Psemu1/9970/gm1.9970_g